MEYTEEQRASFKQQFAVRRKRQFTLAVPLVVFFVAATLLTDEKTGVLLGMPRAVTVPAFSLLVGGAIVFTLWNWRCPACGGYLGRGVRSRFCSKCGVALR